MVRTLLFQIIIVFTITACMSQKQTSQKIGEYTVYYLPMSNSYYSALVNEKIKTISNVKKVSESNLHFTDSLYQMINLLDTTILIKTQSYIDARVLIEVKNRYSVSFSRTGVFFYDGKVYQRNNDIIKYIEKNLPFINWEFSSQ